MSESDKAVESIADKSSTIVENFSLPENSSGSTGNVNAISEKTSVSSENITESKDIDSSINDPLNSSNDLIICSDINDSSRVKSSEVQEPSEALREVDGESGFSSDAESAKKDDDSVATFYFGSKISPSISNSQKVSDTKIAACAKTDEQIDSEKSDKPKKIESDKNGDVNALDVSEESKSSKAPEIVEKPIRIDEVVNNEESGDKLILPRSSKIIIDKEDQEKIPDQESRSNPPCTKNTLPPSEENLSSDSQLIDQSTIADKQVEKSDSPSGNINEKKPKQEAEVGKYFDSDKIIQSSSTLSISEERLATPKMVESKDEVPVIEEVDTVSDEKKSGVKCDNFDGDMKSTSNFEEKVRIGENEPANKFNNTNLKEVEAPTEKSTLKTDDIVTCEISDKSVLCTEIKENDVVDKESVSNSLGKSEDPSKSKTLLTFEKLPQNNLSSEKIESEKETPLNIVIKNDTNNQTEEGNSSDKISEKNENVISPLIQSNADNVESLSVNSLPTSVSKELNEIDKSSEVVEKSDFSKDSKKSMKSNDANVNPTAAQTSSHKEKLSSDKSNNIVKTSESNKMSTISEREDISNEVVEISSEKKDSTSEESSKLKEKSNDCIERIETSIESSKNSLCVATDRKVGEIVSEVSSQLEISSTSDKDSLKPSTEPKQTEVDSQAAVNEEKNIISVQVSDKEKFVSSTEITSISLKVDMEPAKINQFINNPCQEKPFENVVKNVKSNNRSSPKDQSNESVLPKSDKVSKSCEPEPATKQIKPLENQIKNESDITKNDVPKEKGTISADKTEKKVTDLDSNSPANEKKDTKDDISGKLETVISNGASDKTSSVCQKSKTVEGEKTTSPNDLPLKQKKEPKNISAQEEVLSIVCEEKNKVDLKAKPENSINEGKSEKESKLDSKVTPEDSLSVSKSEEESKLDSKVTPEDSLSENKSEEESKSDVKVRSEDSLNEKKSEEEKSNLEEVTESSINSQTTPIDNAEFSQSSKESSSVNKPENSSINSQKISDKTEEENLSLKKEEVDEKSTVLSSELKKPVIDEKASETTALELTCEEKNKLDSNVKPENLINESKSEKENKSNCSANMTVQEEKLGEKIIKNSGSDPKVPSAASSSKIIKEQKSLKQLVESRVVIEPLTSLSVKARGEKAPVVNSGVKKTSAKNVDENSFPSVNSDFGKTSPKNVDNNNEVELKSLAPKKTKRPSSPTKNFLNSPISCKKVKSSEIILEQSNSTTLKSDIKDITIITKKTATKDSSAEIPSKTCDIKKSPKSGGTKISADAPAKIDNQCKEKPEEVEILPSHVESSREKSVDKCESSNSSRSPDKELTTVIPQEKDQQVNDKISSLNTAEKSENVLEVTRKDEPEKTPSDKEDHSRIIATESKPQIAVSSIEKKEFSNIPDKNISTSSVNSLNASNQILVTSKVSTKNAADKLSSCTTSDKVLKSAKISLRDPKISIDHLKLRSDDASPIEVSTKILRPTNSSSKDSKTKDSRFKLKSGALMSKTLPLNDNKRPVRRKANASLMADGSSGPALKIVKTNQQSTGAPSMLGNQSAKAASAIKNAMKQSPGRINSTLEMLLKNKNITCELKTISPQLTEDSGKPKLLKVEQILNQPEAASNSMRSVKQLDSSINSTLKSDEETYLLSSNGETTISPVRSSVPTTRPRSSSIDLVIENVVAGEGEISEKCLLDFNVQGAKKKRGRPRKIQPGENPNANRREEVPKELLEPLFVPHEDLTDSKPKPVVTEKKEEKQPSGKIPSSVQSTQVGETAQATQTTSSTPVSSATSTTPVTSATPMVLVTPVAGTTSGIPVTLGTPLTPTISATPASPATADTSATSVTLATPAGSRSVRTCRTPKEPKKRGGARPNSGPKAHSSKKVPKEPVVVEPDPDETEKLKKKQEEEAQKKLEEKERRQKERLRKLELRNKAAAEKKLKLKRRAEERKRQYYEKKKRLQEEKAEMERRRALAPPQTFEEETQMGDEGDDSFTSESNRNKKGRMEVIDPESSKEFKVHQVAEYQWPLQGGEFFMLQEQISQYLGVKSFKRKYPDIQRRPIEAEEKTFLCDSGLVSETMCDLGLTALRSADVLDIMFADFQDKYEEFRKHLRDMQAKEFSLKQLALAGKPSGDQLDTIERAVQSAARWNSALNKSRRESRRCALDLQTFVIQYPRGKHPKMTKCMPRLGNYPLSLIPGQYSDYYKHYSVSELRYFPLNTVSYGPIKPYEVIMRDSHDGFVSDSNGSSSSDGSSCSSSDSDSDDSTHEVAMEVDSNERVGAICKVCGGNKSKNKKNRPEVLIHCAQCTNSCHPTCLDLSVGMVPHIQRYDWQCTDCKKCAQCKEAADEDKMLFCDLCDRGYHIYCVGLRKVPLGRWHCQECAVCALCSVTEPGPNETSLWHHEYKRSGRGGKNVYLRTFCENCVKMYDPGEANVIKK